MDIVSHGVWGGVISKRESLLIGFLFGMLPDIIGMGGVWEWRLYLSSHSLIALAIIILISLTIFKTWVYAIAYAFHLFLDVFTHHSGTFPLFYVPFLWQGFDPIGFDGWNWWEDGLPFEIINLICVVVVIILYFRKRNLGIKI